MKNAIVLGGTVPHIDLINALKNKGYHIILIDYLENPPGAKYADEHLRESTLDLDKVLKVAKNRKAELVISACIDQANSTCAYVAERLGLPAPYSYETSLDVTDKGRMKKKFLDCDVPTSAYIVVNSVEDIPWDKIDYPAVVKPVDCNSSKGVYKAYCRSDVEKYVGKDIIYSRKGQAIIEGFNNGFEIQIDCFSDKEGGTRVLLTRQKRRVSNKSESVLQSTGSLIPAQLSTKLQKDAADIAQKIASVFCLKNTPFFYQAIVTDKGISVLEFAPRIGAD